MEHQLFWDNKIKDESSIISEISEKINSGSTFEETFDYVFDGLREFLPYNRIGIALLDDEGINIRAARARSDMPIHLGGGYQLSISKTSLAKVIETGQPRIINDLEKYIIEHQDSHSTRVIMEEGMRSSITLPLKIDSRCVGVMFFSSTRKNAYNESHIFFLKKIVNNMALSIEKSILVTNLVLSTVEGFAKLVESRDPETGMHLERMRNYAKLIAQTLSMTSKYNNIIDNNFIDRIYRYSPLHDIGKVGIRDEILLKPGKLTADEFETMKKHTTIGADVLIDVQRKIGKHRSKIFDTAIDIILFHHEKYNGTGYPKGLKGEEIPLAARIVAVADVFDALSSKRPYKAAMSIDKAYSIIVSGRGSHFDPDCVDAFCEIRSDVEVIMKSMQDE